MERRKSVEKRLEEQRKEQQELNQLMADKINTDLKRAQSVKESKEKEQILVSGSDVRVSGCELELEQILVSGSDVRVSGCELEQILVSDSDVRVSGCELE